MPTFENGVDVRSGSHASNYVAKWGLDYELSKSHIKKGKLSISKTPFQLLDDYENGDNHARILFREYSQAFKGKCQLYWSKGLKAFFDITAKTDTEILEEVEEKSEKVISINRKDWRNVVKHKAQAYILTLAELRTKHEIINFLGILKNAPRIKRKCLMQFSKTA